MYGKVIDKKTGLCEVAFGTNIEYYISIGYRDLDISQSDLDNAYYLTEKCPMKTDEQKAKEEAERIARLHLTKREVFLGLHKAKQVTPDMIKAKITDPEALIEFEYATEYYRGNPLIDMVGEALGITPKQLDMFFDTNDYLYLTDCTIAINPTPIEAVVTINDIVGNSLKVPYSTPVYWSVDLEGYKSQSGGLNIRENTKYDIILEKEELPYEDTTNEQSTIPDETANEENLL